MSGLLVVSIVEIRPTQSSVYTERKTAIGMIKRSVKVFAGYIHQKAYPVSLGNVSTSEVIYVSLNALTRQYCCRASPHSATQPRVGYAQH